MSATSYETTLEPETITAFDAYIAEAEKQMNESRYPLWSSRDPKTAKNVRGGDAVVHMWSGDKPVAVAHGLIHDWVGAVFVPGATVDRTLALVQDYDNHQNIYAPDVMRSKLVGRNGDRFQIYLRLLKKKIITVVLDTEHDVQYSSLSPTCWVCKSYTTRIAEVQDAGAPNEKAMPPGTGYGFLWRLYSYWIFNQENAGTTIECRAISLTRDIPASLKLFVQPVVRKLPKESLVATLVNTRNALLQKHEAAVQ